MSFDRARVEFDHNRLLKRVANEVFGPLGLVQRGSSRVWFDDQKLPGLPMDSIVEALDAASTVRTAQRSWWRRWTS